MKITLLLLAAILTANAAIAFFAQLSPDFELYTLGAILCIGTKIVLDHIQEEKYRSTRKDHP